MSGASKLAWIQAHLAAGRTVYVRTMTRATPIKSMDVGGYPTVKLGAGDALRMLEGFTRGRPRYVDASYCTLEVSA